MIPSWKEGDVLPPPREHLQMFSILCLRNRPLILLPPSGENSIYAPLYYDQPIIFKYIVGLQANFIHGGMW